MLPPVTDVVIRSGSKSMVNVQFLDKMKEHLRGLPEKPKELFEFQEAANYIRKDITSALHKNYTQNDLSDMFISFGWPQDGHSIRSFWRAFLFPPRFQNADIFSAPSRGPFLSARVT